jgi:hypothetical protein
MPQVTVYIRKEDLDKWKALENKAAFISQHLNNKPTIIKNPESRGSTKKEPWGLEPELQAILDKPDGVRVGPIPDQLEALGLKYDHTLPGEAFDPDTQTYVKYKVVDNEVIL